MRDIFPTKFYSEGDYLARHAKFDFDEIKVVNNRPMNIWLYAKCRKYVDREASEKQQGFEAGHLGAELKVKGKYDVNPTGR